MACFSLAWIETLCIYAIIIGAVFAIMKIIIPYALAQLGGGAVIVQVLNIIGWAIIAIIIVYIVFALVSCLIGGGFSLMPHR